ncbi:MAG: type II secretion system F family protein [Acidimicrobiia bacterium]|nr:type II secretion system F family protein [Acidimicrobiia bacterium]
MWTAAIAVALFVVARRGDTTSLPSHPAPGGAVRSWTMVPRRRQRNASLPEDLQAVAAALVVGTAAGLSLQSSLELAATLGPSRRGELDDVLRDARNLGLGVALARSGGKMSPLFARLARAQVSGAPLAATVAGFAAEEREIRRSARIEAARKLPVRLTIPLALLVLPGFVLLTAGPAAVGSLQRMLGPLMP